jgi:hypothetical protein
MMMAVPVDGSATIYCHEPVLFSKMLWIVGSVGGRCAFWLADEGEE